MAGNMYIGIDPGQSGGISWIERTVEDGRQVNFIYSEKMPATEHDVDILFKKLKSRGMNMKCIIEAVHSMPGQGVASSFKFGRNYGFLRGLLVANRIPFDQVSPQKWQKTLGLQKKSREETKTQHKNNIKGKAQQLYPQLKVTLAVADAIMLATYCANQKMAVEAI